MRRLMPALVMLAFGFASETGAQTGNADAVMAAARAALGGEAKIAAVKTFIATGRTRQVRGENLVPIEFEIQAELPDKYSRRDEFPAQDAGPVTAGFVGDALVLIPRPVQRAERDQSRQLHRLQRDDDVAVLPTADGRRRDSPRRRGHQLWILSEVSLTTGVQNATRTENSLAGLLGQKRLHVSIFEAVTTLEHRLHFFPANSSN